MATVVNNPTVERERVIETDSGAGWAVAVIVLLAVIAVGAYFWTHRAPAAAPNTGNSINVTLPSAGYQPSGDTSGTGGNAQTAPTQ